MNQHHHANRGREARIRGLSPRSAATRGLAGLCAAALLLSACGSDTSDASSGESTEQDLSTALLGMSEEEFFTRTEQEVQKCMTAKGWEYEINNAQAFADMAGGGLGDDPAEFARENGYGLLGFGTGDTGAIPVEADAVSDPNSAYINSLSPADQDAYMSDLFGPISEDSMEVGAAGCYGEANEKVAGPGGLEAMNARFEQVQEFVAADADVVAATKEWSACMADAGFAYTSPEDAVNDLIERVATIDTSDEAATEAFRQEEITIAVADQECQTSSGLVEANEAALKRAVEELGNS